MTKIIQIVGDSQNYMLWALTDDGDVYSIQNRPMEGLEPENWNNK